MARGKQYLVIKTRPVDDKRVPITSSVVLTTAWAYGYEGGAAPLVKEQAVELPNFDYPDADVWDSEALHDLVEIVSIKRVPEHYVIRTDYVEFWAEQTGNVVHDDGDLESDQREAAEALASGE